MKELLTAFIALLASVNALLLVIGQPWKDSSGFVVLYLMLFAIYSKIPKQNAKP